MEQHLEANPSSRDQRDQKLIDYERELKALGSTLGIDHDKVGPKASTLQWKNSYEGKAGRLLAKVKAVS